MTSLNGNNGSVVFWPCSAVATIESVQLVGYRFIRFPSLVSDSFRLFVSYFGGFKWRTGSLKLYKFTEPAFQRTSRFYTILYLDAREERKAASSVRRYYNAQERSAPKHVEVRRSKTSDLLIAALSKFLPREIWKM